MPLTSDNDVPAVAVVSAGAGFGLARAAKPLKTPAGAAFVVPSRKLAEAIAEEWNAAGAKAVHAPLLKLARTAIDRVAPATPETVAELLRYANTDLLCYRAEPGSELAARQAAAWDPFLAWAEKALAIHFAVTSGVMPLMQAKEAEEGLARILAKENVFVLTALHVMAALMGSIVLGLALRHKRCDVGGAWAAATVDETFQCERWGVDPEAENRSKLMQKALAEAERFLRLAEDTV